MEFKKFSVGHYKYGETDPTVDMERMKREGITNVNFSDPILDEHMRDVSCENFSNINRFMEILAVCHTVIAEKAKGSKGSDNLTYNASSPDELALVNAAKYFGYYFKGRDEDNNMLVETNFSNEEVAIGNPVK